MNRPHPIVRDPPPNLHLSTVYWGAWYGILPYLLNEQHWRQTAPLALLRPSAGSPPVNGQETLSPPFQIHFACVRVYVVTYPLSYPCVYVWVYRMLYLALHVRVHRMLYLLWRQGSQSRADIGRLCCCAVRCVCVCAARVYACAAYVWVYVMGVGAMGHGWHTCVRVAHPCPEQVRHDVYACHVPTPTCLPPPASIAVVVQALTKQRT